MRIAILASPRCGNNWVRRVISEMSGYPHFAAHSVDDFPAELPDDCILNIHAVYDERTKDYFERLSCKLVVLGRHPLDVFVSVLQFARNEPAVHSWLGGKCFIPANSLDLCPDDDEFVGWMCSEGARNLLSVTLSWWNTETNAARVKYEDFVDDPETRYLQLIDELRIPMVGSIESSLKNYSVSYFAQFKNHGWLGQKDNYAKFITHTNCTRVLDAHKDYFSALRYDIKDNYDLDHETAKAAYLQTLPKAAG